NLLVIALMLVIIFSPSTEPYNVLRIILGLPLMFFTSGYALVALLFPKEEGVDVYERLALSFGLSIAIVALIGLILNSVPAGITIESVVYSTTGFTLALSAVAAWRRNRLQHTERFNLGGFSGLPGWQGGIFGKLLSVVLVITILGALGVTVYIIAGPRPSESFTEFYILNQQGESNNYPEVLSAGEAGQVVAVIINHEQAETTYYIDTVIDGINFNHSEAITLEDGSQWQVSLTFTPTSTGEDQKVEFQLIKNGTLGVYRSVHIWVDVE
ncbi:DUF1616 domain-containing protein, partial [Chloroflexota bacterium]